MKIDSRYLPWLWFACGVVLLPFTAYRNVVAAAAWIAPVLLLRFVRTSKRSWLALLAILAAYAGAYLVDEIGTFGTSAFALLTLPIFPLLIGFFYLAPYAADRLIGRRLTMWPRLLVFPAAFVVVTWIGSLLRAIGTFGTPAYSQYGVLPIDQLASVTGMWGITFLIMWFASTANAVWEHNFQWRSVLRPVALFVAVVLGVTAFGFVRLGAFGPSSPSEVAATITIDDNVLKPAAAYQTLTFNQSTDQQRAAARPAFQATVAQMLARTQTAMQRGAKLVSWQEDSAQVLAEDRQAVIDSAAALARQYDAYLDITMMVYTKTTSQQYLLNQSVLIDKTGSVLFSYEKSYPIFITESIVTPYGPGVVPAVATPYGTLSTYICNDRTYPALLRQAGQSGADIVFGPTHEPFSPYASADAAQATFRAIESGFSLVSPAGDGVSLITDFNGNVIASQTYPDGGGILIANVPAHGVTTVYSKVGDVFVYLCVLALVLLIGVAFVYRRQIAPAAARPQLA